MPFLSKRQQRWANSTGQPFAKKWNKLTNFSALPEKKDSGVSGMAIPPTGANALFNQPGIQSRAKRRKKKRKEVCTCTITTKASTGQPGELIAPGVRRIHGNLCNVHGRYGPCDKGTTGKPKKGKQPAKAKLTPAQRAAQRDTEHQANRGKTLSQQGYSADDQSALEALRSGAQPAKVSSALIDQGVVEQATDGSYRLTSSGRALMSAAGQGNAGRARDTVSGARDRLSARRQRQAAAAKRQQDTAGKRAASQMDRELAKRQRVEQAAAKKPGKAQSAAHKKKPAAQAMPAKAPAKRRVARSSSPSAPAVQSSPKPKAPAKVPSSPSPKAAIAPALHDAAQALSDGDDVTDEQLQQLITNGLVKLNRDGTPILTAAGQRATMKAYEPGQLCPYCTADLALPDVGWYQCGHCGEQFYAADTDSDYEDYHAYRADRAPQRGAPPQPSSMPTARVLKSPRIAEKAFTVIKSSDGTPDRWLSITTTAYEDKDREIISTKAIKGAVALGDQTGERGPLLYWHIPGLEMGDCDFQAQGGPGGRFLIEGGTFRSKAFAELGRKLSDSGYQMSPGFVHTDDQPQNGVYDTILIYERSAVPQNRAANYFTRYATKEDKVITPEKAAEYREKAAGNTEALALLDTLLATTAKEDATAQARNVVFKEAAALPAEIEIGGVVYTVKAFPPSPAAPVEGSPEEEAAETPDEEAVEMDDGGDGGMDDAAFAQMIAQAVVQALSPLLDMEKKMAGHVNDMKSMVSGIGQQKDDAAVAATAATQQQIAALEAKLKELTGDLPSSVMNGASNLYRPSQSPLTKLTEGAAAVVKEQISQVPAGLSDPNEIAAYQLIFGNS